LLIQKAGKGVPMSTQIKKRINVIIAPVLFFFVLSAILGGCTTTVRAENSDNPDFHPG